MFNLFKFLAVCFLACVIASRAPVPIGPSVCSNGGGLPSVHCKVDPCNIGVNPCVPFDSCVTDYDADAGAYCSCLATCGPVVCPGGHPAVQCTIDPCDPKINPCNPPKSCDSGYNASAGGYCKNCQATCTKVYTLAT